MSVDPMDNTEYRENLKRNELDPCLAYQPYKEVGAKMRPVRCRFHGLNLTNLYPFLRKLPPDSIRTHFSRQPSMLF